MTRIPLELRAQALGIDHDHPVGELGEGYYCFCGCRETTSYTGGRWRNFRPGHDARLVGQLLRKAREGSIDINEAIEVLELVCDSDKLSNKLRGLWLRVGRKITPRIAHQHGKTIVCALPPHEGTPVEWDPRHKTDNQPWLLGVLRYKNSEVRVAD